MNRTAMIRPAIVLLVTSVSLAARSAPQAPTDLSAAKIAGSWTAVLSHAGETRPIGLGFAAVDDHAVTVTMTNPALHIEGLPIGKATIEGSAVRVGDSLSLQYDAASDTLRCLLPAGLVPLYKMEALFHRGAIPSEPPRELTGTIAAPVWTFDAGSPIWADVAAAGGSVFAGADDGRLHAIDAASGHERWTFATGGPIRSRPTIASGALYAQSDDGFLYRLNAGTGAVEWKVRVSEKPAVRLPPSDPKSRFNRFASAVTVSGSRLYLGTDDGHVLALEAATGARVWSFAAGDSVNSTPSFDGHALYVGSFDHHVYAIDAGTGTLLWKRDTGAPVVSTPALHGRHLIVGSRSYDLLALDTATGTAAWTRYIWFSWIESSAVVRGDTAYVGSSDAAKLYAFDASTGGTRWDLDVMGWAWGEPAVSSERVFIGTAGAAKYPVRHQPGLLAVDRATGTVVWRYPMVASDTGTYGFPASPVLSGDLVAIGGVDGKVYAFRQ